MNKSLINNDKIIYLNKLVDLINDEREAKEFYVENKDKFSEISPFEVFSIKVFSLDNVEISRIKEIAGKVVNLLRNGLLEFKWNKNISLIQKLLEEGKTIKNKFNSFKTYLIDKDYSKLVQELDIIDELKKRFLKMENVIFSILEAKDVNPKPLQVIWSLHDDVISLHKQLLTELENNTKELNITIGKYFFLVLGIIEKEELFILPILEKVLTVNELISLEKEVDNYGYAFISEAKTEENHYETPQDDYLFNSKNGKLNLDELISILNCVGDITYIDSDNKVKFFNTPHKHFARSQSIIGRDVRNCHPSKSVHIVNEIIDRFRSGKEDRVDFWINIKGKLILISYFAIRNANNKYLGVLELTQDITDISEITGEKRIVDFN